MITLRHIKIAEGAIPSVVLCCLMAGCGGEPSLEAFDSAKLQASTTVENPAENLDGPEPGVAEAAPETAEDPQPAIETNIEVPDDPDTVAEPIADGPTDPSADKPDVENPEAVKPGEVKLLIKDKTFRKEGDLLRVSYDDIDLLKVLNMSSIDSDPSGKFPSWLSGLAGKRVKIRGYMYPPELDTGIPFFLLARDNKICCFGRNPKLYDMICVKMRSGTTTDYIQGRPFDVVGTFRVKYDGDLSELYHLDDAQVVTR